LQCTIKGISSAKPKTNSHYRLDYPELDNENWQAWINILKGEDGEMQFERQPYGSWPV